MGKSVNLPWIEDILHQLKTVVYPAISTIQGGTGSFPQYVDVGLQYETEPSWLVVWSIFHFEKSV